MFNNLNNNNNKKLNNLFDFTNNWSLLINIIIELCNIVNKNQRWSCCKYFKGGFEGTIIEWFRNVY